MHSGHALLNDTMWVFDGIQTLFAQQTRVHSLLLPHMRGTHAHASGPCQPVPTYATWHSRAAISAHIHSAGRAAYSAGPILA